MEGFKNHNCKKTNTPHRCTLINQNKYYTFLFKTLILKI